MTLNQLIEQLIADGGAIVSSNDCSEMEIAIARSQGRFSVNENSFGFVRRPKEWLEMQKQRLLQLAQANTDIGKLQEELASAEKELESCHG